jgi:hypothetical protein
VEGAEGADDLEFDLGHVTVQQGVSGDELKGQFFSEEEACERLEDGAILFFERRAAGSDGGKAWAPWKERKADDLESDLGHSHFAVGVIVGEGDLRIREKAQNLLFPFVQASKEVDGASLWRFPGIAITSILGLAD